MVKLTQAIRCQFVDELFKCVWPLRGVGAKRVKYVKYILHINPVSLPILSIHVPSGYENYSTRVILEYQPRSRSPSSYSEIMRWGRGFLERAYYLIKMPNFRYESIIIKSLFSIFVQSISIVYSKKKNNFFNDQQRQKSMWRIFLFFERRKLHKININRSSS